MLKDVKKTRQYKDEMSRRWFSDENMDLIVWFKDGDEIAGFQLCYDKPFAEHALTWQVDSGFVHNRVDDGEDRPGRHKSTPLLLHDGSFNMKEIAEKFLQASTEIDKEIVDFIHEQLQG